MSGELSTRARRIRVECDSENGSEAIESRATLSLRGCRSHTWRLLHRLHVIVGKWGYMMDLSLYCHAIINGVRVRRYRSGEPDISAVRVTPYDVAKRRRWKGRRLATYCRFRRQGGSGSLWNHSRRSVMSLRN